MSLHTVESQHLRAPLNASRTPQHSQQGDNFYTGEDLTSMVEAYIYNSTVNVKLNSAFYQLLIGCYATVLILAAAGNALMLYAILSTWRERKNLHHRCFYLNLIVCDLLVALIILPATCADHLDNRWFLGQPLCKVRHSLSVSLMCCSVFTLTCLSWQRSLGISGNVVSWMDRRRKMIRNELLAIGSIWAAAVIISIPAARVSVIEHGFGELTAQFEQFMVRPVNWPICKENWNLMSPTGSDNVTAETWSSSGKFWYGLAILNLVCLLPLLSLGVAYFRICRAIYLSNRILNVHKRYEAMLSTSYQASDTTLVRLSSMRHHFSLASTCSAVNRRKRVATSRRMFLLGVALVIIFAITWLPMQCLQLYRACIGRAESDAELMHKLVYAFHLLALTNSLFNPYFLMATHSLYRRQVKRLARRLQCCCGCRISWRFVRSTDRFELQQF